MAFPKNIVNKRFGRLLVVKRNPVNGNRRQVRWDCICDCGNQHTVTSESLNNGKSKSCGCLLREARYAKNKNFDRERAMLLLVYSPLKKRHNLRFSNTQYISVTPRITLCLAVSFVTPLKTHSVNPNLRNL